MRSGIVFLFRFAVRAAVGFAMGLAAIVVNLPHPRFVIARFFVDLFGSGKEWIEVAMPVVLTLMGVWLALQQVSRKARILWVSILLIIGVGAAMVNLSLLSQNQIDHALRMMQQDITMQVLTRSSPPHNWNYRPRDKMSMSPQMPKHQLKTPLPAILHKPGGQKEFGTIPAGAVVEEASRHSATLEGKVGVYWEGRHYSVSMKDLLTSSGKLGGRL